MNPHQQAGEHHSEPSNFWLKAVVVAVLFIGCFFVMTPVVMKTSKKAAIAHSTSNAKQVFYLLVDFDRDHNMFPCDATAVGKLAGFKGEYSNDYMGQFLAGGYTQTEEIFYAKGGSGKSKKPDNEIEPKEEILSEGECGFAYIKGLGSDGLVETPILATPMYGDGFKFDPYIYEGKCVILRIDGAVKQLRINKGRHAAIKGKQTLFSGGAESVWGETGFDRKNLCYAKSPYKPTYVISTRVKNINPMTISIICMALAILCCIIQKNKRGSAKK